MSYLVVDILNIEYVFDLIYDIVLGVQNFWNDR